MNLKLSVLALLIFVSPLCVAQEVQEKTSKRNTIKTAVITVGSIIAGVFLAYVGYRSYGNLNKVNEPTKPESQDEAIPAQPEEVEKVELSSEERSELLKIMLEETIKRNAELKKYVESEMKKQQEQTAQGE